MLKISSSFHFRWKKKNRSFSKMQPLAVKDATFCLLLIKFIIGCINLSWRCKIMGEIFKLKTQSLWGSPCYHTHILSNKPKLRNHIISININIWSIYWTGSEPIRASHVIQSRTMAISNHQNFAVQLTWGLLYLAVTVFLSFSLVPGKRSFFKDFFLKWKDVKMQWH